MGSGRTLIAHDGLVEARWTALFGTSDTLADYLFPLIFAVVGAAIGSFAGACALRIARGDGVVSGRSRCDSCGKVLSPMELVPVLSFAFLMGRCRACRAPIDRLQPFAEISGAAIGLAAWWSTSTFSSAALLAVLGWQLLVLALSDWRSFHLPPAGITLLATTALLIPLQAWGMGLAIIPILLEQAAGGGLGFLLLAAPALAFRAVRGRDGMGSADPPLMGAIGLWVGPVGVCFILFLAAAMGIAFALAARFTRAGSDRGKGDSDGAIPLGTLLSLATIAVAVAGFSPFLG